MDLLVAAKPWTYWMAPGLVLLAILGVLGAFLAYLLRVVAAKYPKE